MNLLLGSLHTFLFIIFLTDPVDRVHSGKYLFSGVSNAFLDPDSKQFRAIRGQDIAFLRFSTPPRYLHFFVRISRFVFLCSLRVLRGSVVVK